MAKSANFDPLFWRTADRIHDRLKPGQRSLRDLLRPEASWLGWQDCVRRVRKSCLKRCSTCNISRCEDCLDDGLCTDCRPKKEEANPSQAPPQAPDVAFQPVCVGEAAVSA